MKKYRTNIFKGAFVLLITTVMILSTLAVSANTIGSIKELSIEKIDDSDTYILDKGDFTDSFETYTDFALDFPPWTQYDGDGGETWAISGYTFPNQNYAGSFIVMNPSEVEGDPPFEGVHPPVSGGKFIACFDARTEWAPNDDWLFTPELLLESNSVLSFWGRSINDNYGLEHIEVGISTTDTNPSSFTIISPGSFIEVPVEWTEYTFDLSNFEGETIYVGIHVMSFDVFAFFLDDFKVTNVNIPEPDLECEGSFNWVDIEPSSNITDSFTLSNAGEEGSYLNWEITGLPDFGNWTITPSEGAGLTVGDGDITIEVFVEVPADKNMEFTGDIRIENSDNSADFCVIPVTLATPRNANNPLAFDTFEEGFEDSTDIPEGWLNIDSDGDGYFWVVNSNPNTHEPHSGDSCILSESWDSVPLTPDNWLITPKLTLGSSSELTFSIASQDPDWSQEHYQVALSTTNTELSSFTNIIDEWTLPAGTDEWFTDTFDLSAFAGESVYIGFRHYDITDMFQIKLDDIIVTDATVVPPPQPDLECDGTLDWVDIKPNSTDEPATGSFTIENAGEPESLLNWEIIEFPEWGDWTITPLQGSGLTPEAGAITIDVTVVAPDEANTDFTGEIKIVNSNDEADFCIISITLATPKSNAFDLIINFLEDHPNLFPILKQLLGL